jgi:hypothetical protein
MKFDEAACPPPAPRRSTSARPSTATRRSAAHAARRAPRAAAPAERFIPTVDVASRLVIVNGGEPLIFSDEQTAAIAALLFQHYDKG